MRIQIAHDFTCSWCWIGLFQAKRLRRDFGVEIDWIPYELYPDPGPFPSPGKPETGKHADKPKTPSRFQLAMAAEGLEPVAADRPWPIRTHRCHQAVEYAKPLGVADALVERIYNAYWKHALPIDRPEVLAFLSKGLIRDEAAFLGALHSDVHRGHLIPFDDEAFATGVYNVPTFWIGGERYAEQPYAVLERAMRNAGAGDGDPTRGVYASLDYPSAPEARPTVFINMVATIDGKIITGNRNEPVMDLGSKTDHLLMRRIEDSAEAVVIGAGNLRATPKLWYDQRLFRFVVSRSGQVDPSSRFFTDAPERAFLVAPEGVTAEVPVLHFGSEGVDLIALLRSLRQTFGITRLLVEGGSELNAAFLRLGVVDELFLTVAPKIKLGREVPTYAGGEALVRDAVQSYRRIETHTIGDEVFLRYRR